MLVRALGAALALVALAPPASAQSAAPADADAALSRVRSDDAFRRAERALADGHDRFVGDVVALTEIPAPPFAEAERGAAWRALLANTSVEDIRTDDVGNIWGIRRGGGPANGPVLVVSAHLDSVFPAGTDVRVRREGTRLSAPGIGDDARGLAALVAIVRALDEARMETRSDIVILATVGEEGAGDLRGVRHAFAQAPWRDRVSGFISLDGLSPARITSGGVGSKRYRAIFRGPGGHSYGAFGLVNPATAMARAITDLYAVPVPSSPRTTFAAGVVGGGTSVNSIPTETFVEIDMRSESADALARLDTQFRDIAARAVAAENESRSTREGAVTVELKPIGDRPAGATPADSAIVRLSEASARAAGYTPVRDASSTDANLPMSLGIPSVTLGSGGTGGRAHALDEWIDVEPAESLRGLTAAMATIVALANRPEGADQPSDDGSE